MSNNSNNSTSGGMSLASVLFVVFLILKLTGVINWSWWWVTAPLWGGIAIILFIFLSILIIGGLFSYLSDRRLQKEMRKTHLDKWEHDKKTHPYK